MSVVLEWLGNAGALLFVFVAIGLCIFFHELGHFLAAKWRGLHIDSFALGFRPFWRKKIHGVEYRLGWLPFGGYCEIPQVDATDAEPRAADGTLLPRAKPLDRIITAVAGPLFNILSGLLIGCIVWAAGMPQDSPKMRSLTVRSIEKDGPEYAAGLRAGDRIVRLNGERFNDTWMEFVRKLLFTVGEVRLGVERSGNDGFEIRYVPRVNPNAPGKLTGEGIAWPFFRPLIPLELAVRPGGPAARAGIADGDILLAIDGTDIDDYNAFQLAVDQAGPRPVKLRLLRGGSEFDATVEPQAIPGLGEEYTLYLIGVSMATGNDAERGIRIAAVSPGSSAMAAGVRSGDVLTAADSFALKRPEDLQKLVRETFRDKPFTLTLLRGGEEKKITLAARRITPHAIGVTIALVDHPTPLRQLADTAEMSWKSLRGIAVGIGNKLGLTAKQSSIRPSHMSGPLGIGLVLFNSVRRSSLVSGIYFMTMISFALALFNLLPLPVLDGGHTLFGIIEIVIRRPLPVRLIKILTAVFVTLLIGLMVFVTISDSRRIYREFAPQEKANGSAQTQP